MVVGIGALGIVGMGRQRQWQKGGEGGAMTSYFQAIDS